MYWTEWTTASEFNVNRFEIEVARGNTAFQQNQFVKIGEESSLGNSNQQQHYQFTDIENNKSGVRFYRLKIIENDGSFKYSPVRPVVFDEEIKWQVTPNPSTGIFNFIYQVNVGETITATLYDINGKKVKEYHAVANGFVEKIGIDIKGQQFAAGLYLLQAVTGDKKQSFKLVKQ
jgi:hypothetical protein